MKRLTLFSIVLFLGFVQFCDAQYYYNRCYSMDGNNANYVSVPPPSGTLNITGSFTLECWLKPNNITGAQMIIKKGDDVGNLTGYALLMDAGRVRIRTNGSTRLTGTTAIPIGVWSHFAGTYNSATNTFSAFINGVAAGTAIVAGANPLSNANDSVLFGRGFNSPYNGQIDEIRIWNVARVGAEIVSTMRMPLGESFAGLYPGLVGAWRGNIVTGGSGNEEISGHNAVLRGSASYVLVGDKPGGYTAYNTGALFTGVAGTNMTAPHAAPLNITGSFTLECWVNPVNVATPSFQILIQKRLGSAAAGYTMYLSTGKVSVRTNSSTRLTGTTTIPNGIWSHVAATYNSTTNVFTVYVNGIADGTITTAGAAPAADTDSLRLATGFNSPYAGLMDEVRICNYPKTAEEIQKEMFVSIDANNEPAPTTNTNISYSFEGTLHGTDGSSRGRFNGAAAFTQVFNNATQFPSPLDRVDAGSLANGYRVKYANLLFGAAPTTITDSIFMPQSLTITDVNVYVAVVHTFANDISVSLRNPANSTTRVLYPGGTPNVGMHMITVFDDQADSTIGGAAPWSPRVKPTNNLAVFNTHNSSGWWKIILTDIFPGADNGRLMGWGIQFNNQTITGSEQGGITEVPVRFNLYQNYPNPFNPATTIKYDIAKDVDVEIVIYDILGKEVQTLVDEHKKAGSYTILVNFGNLASGIYMYKIKAGDFVDVKKMILVK